MFNVYSVRVKQKINFTSKQADMSIIEFNKKIDNVSQYLHSFALNLTKNSEDAKDLFQRWSTKTSSLPIPTLKHGCSRL